jgi:hypothetical protein
MQFKQKSKQSSPTTRHGGAWTERRCNSYSFLTSALDAVSGQSQPRPHFTPGERTPGTHCTGGWVDPRAGLDTEAKGKILLPLPGIEPQSPARPVRSQTLYWLSYPGSMQFKIVGEVEAKLRSLLTSPSDADESLVSWWTSRSTSE